VAVEELTLQRREERLGDGVLQGVADGAHRPEQTGGAETLTEHPAAVVRSVIRVGDRPGGRPPAQGGHVDGIGDESARM
jgi:hypothetical protein